MTRTTTQDQHHHTPIPPVGLFGQPGSRARGRKGERGSEKERERQKERRNLLAVELEARLEVRGRRQHPYTLHPTLYNLHPTPYTTHTTHFAPHSTLYTLHATRYSAPAACRARGTTLPGPRTPTTSRRAALSPAQGSWLRERERERERARGSKSESERAGERESGRDRERETEREFV